MKGVVCRWIMTVLGRADLVDVTNAIGGARRIGHVKAWGCEGTRYQAGDRVPHLRNRSTYSIPTAEGFWINVGQGVIVSWSAKPVMDTVADVYGRVRIAPVRGRL